jgi:hypothetical protein
MLYVYQASIIKKNPDQRLTVARNTIQGKHSPNDQDIIEHCSTHPLHYVSNVHMT